MRALASATLLVLLALSFAAPAAAVAGAEDGQELQNPSFENVGTGVPGWTMAQGAKTDGSGASSKLVIDRTVASEGLASLRVEGRADTSLWNFAEQTLPARAGDRVSVRARARCRGVMRQNHQFNNAHVHLMFVDAAGNRLAFKVSAPLSRDRDWTTIVVQGVAPKGTTHLRAGLFFSMTGTMWFDDVRVTRAATAPFNKAARESAVRDLADHLARTYTFFGFRGKPTLAVLHEKHEARLIAAETPIAFQAELVRMLADLKDMHVWLKTPRGIVPVFQPRHPPNWNVAAIKKRLTKTYFWENNLLAGEIGEFGYLGLGSFQFGKEQQARLHEALDKMRDAPGIVIDVRFNVGGNEYVAQKVAARFCANRVLYARNVQRDPDADGGFRRSGERWIGPGAAAAFTRPVVLLQGRNCVSSGEGFVAMMRMFDTVTTMGQPTRGASGNPQPFELWPGLEVWSSTWRSLTPEGECHEGIGLPPDVVIDPPAAEFANADPLLERALAALREQRGAGK